MDSHNSAGGDWGREEHGQASPMETPSTCVRDEGQMLPNPSMRTLHNVGMVTIGTDDARVVGCDSK